MVIAVDKNDFLICTRYEEKVLYQGDGARIIPLCDVNRRSPPTETGEILIKDKDMELPIHVNYIAAATATNSGELT